MRAFAVLSLGICTAAALLLPLPFPALAASSSTTLHVSATVLPWMQFSAVQHRHSYRVTDEDTRRGYLDLPQAIFVDLRSNIQGIIELGVLGNGPAEITVALPGSRNFSENCRIEARETGASFSGTLDVRVLLPADLMAGVYPLEIVLAPRHY